MERFMSEKELENFEQTYREHRIIEIRDNRFVNDRDLLILHDYKEGMMMGELAKKYKVSNARIKTSLRLAALSKL